jgi:hypothetical protein
MCAQSYKSASLFVEKATEQVVIIIGLPSNYIYFIVCKIQYKTCPISFVMISRIQIK